MSEENEPKILRVEIIGGPQVTFPFPGEAEINIIARLIPENKVTQRVVAVVVQGDRQIPGIGSQINVHYYEDFYRGRPTTVRGGVPRFCLQ